MDPRFTHADLHEQARRRAHALREQAIADVWRWLRQKLTQGLRRNTGSSTCHS